MKAQNNKRHYETKLAEEKQKVAAIQEVAAVLQEEFQVGLFGHIFGVDWRRFGVAENVELDCESGGVL